MESWRNFIHGDKEAFKTLYDVYADVLFDYGLRFCSDREIVKDGIHDLFVDLYRYRLKLNPDVNVKAYLLSSLRRKLLYLKKNHVIPLSADYIQLEAEYDFAAATENDNEFVTRLRTEMDKLTRRQREALYLRFMREMDYEQVAQIMEISVSSCRTLIYRAMKDLRRRMKGGKISPLLSG